MQHVTSETLDRVAVIRMGRGRANALDGAMIGELALAIGRARDDAGAGAILLASARAGFFSAGFDVAEVFGLDRPAMEAFFSRFIGLYELLAWLDKPVVAAVGGHAMAGGAVLAITADVRIMREGPFSFALNELNLGVVLPPNVKRLASLAMGAPAAQHLLITGRSMDPVEALRLGLAHEVVAEADVDRVALARARELAGKPPRAFAAIKRTLREQAGLVRAISDLGFLPDFLDQWFSFECVEARGRLVRSLKKAP
jgi:enoyl-CoA hydratase/carnithine racemase